jgi:Ca2+-binding EF-hand superfamily protein
MVQEADDNKDGAVDIEEFVKAVLVARSLVLPSFCASAA